MFSVNLELYKGPLEKLLELIEDKKLEITQLNLALVTDDFLKYLEGLKSEDGGRSDEQLRILADFLVVASRLILIKSKSLLPELELTEEEQEDINDLERRLQFYKQFKPAMILLKDLYENNNSMASRPLFFGRPAIFYPPNDLNSGFLHKIIDNFFESMKKMSLEFQTIEMTLIKLEEKIEEIMSKIQTGISDFGHLIKEKSKKEIVVMFLALLHLLREQTVEVEQKEGFGEIKIHRSMN